MQIIMDEEKYWLNNQWDKCIVTVVDEVVVDINLLYCFSAHSHSIPNIMKIPRFGGAADRIQFQPNKKLPALIKKHEWLPWDVFKKEMYLIGWDYWIKL